MAGGAANQQAGAQGAPGATMLKQMPPVLNNVGLPPVSSSPGGPSTTAGMPRPVRQGKGLPSGK